MREGMLLVWSGGGGGVEVGNRFSTHCRVFDPTCAPAFRGVSCLKLSSPASLPALTFSSWLRPLLLGNLFPTFRGLVSGLWLSPFPVGLSQIPLLQL